MNRRIIKKKKAKLRENAKHVNACLFRHNNNKNNNNNNNNNNKQLTIPSFLRYKNVKPLVRSSDICDYCEDSNELLKEINSQMQLMGLDLKDGKHLDVFDAVKDNKTAGAAANPQLISKIQLYREIEYHKEIAKRQRDAYKSHMINKELLKNALLIDMDYKAMIKLLGKNRPTGNIFGLGIYYLDENETTINKINVDIITSLSNEASTTVALFSYLREQAFFKKIDKHNYVLWMSLHFRCNQLVDYFLVELAKQSISVNLNYFCVKHANSSRDQHFAAIARFIIINKKKLFKQKLLLNSQDIYDAINESSNLYNSSQASQTIPLIYTLGFNNKLKETSQTTQQVVENLDAYYNVRSVSTNGHFEIKTSVFSDKVCMSSDYNQINLKSTNGLEARSILDLSKLINANDKKLDDIISELIANKLEENDSDNELLLSDYITYDIIENISLSKPTEPTAAQIFKLAKHCNDNCKLCVAPIGCTVDELNEKTPNGKYVIGQKVIREQLSIHGHPKSRFSDTDKKRLADTHEQRKDLIEHLKLIHNL